MSLLSGVKFVSKDALDARRDARESKARSAAEARDAESGMAAWDHELEYEQELETSACRTQCMKKVIFMIHAIILIIYLQHWMVCNKTGTNR